MRKLLLLFLSICCVVVFATQACAVRNTNWQPKESQYWIRVNKARMMLTLYQGKEVVVSYPIACGKGKGFKKTSRFDFITPTGTYKIWRVIEDASKIKYDPAWFNEDGEPYPAYGVKIISFYNNWQIAIHGTWSPRSIGKKVTHGCVRLRNSDIIALCKYVKPPMHLEIIDGVDDPQAYGGSHACEERFFYKESLQLAITTGQKKAWDKKKRGIEKNTGKVDISYQALAKYEQLMTESEFALDAGFCANPMGFAERLDKAKSE